MTMHKYLLEVGTNIDNLSNDEKQIIKDRAELAERLLSNTDLKLAFQIMELKGAKELNKLSGTSEEQLFKLHEYRGGNVKLPRLLREWIAVNEKLKMNSNKVVEKKATVHKNFLKNDIKPKKPNL